MSVFLIGTSAILMAAVIAISVAAYQKNALLAWAAKAGRDTSSTRADASHLQSLIGRFGRWQALQHVATAMALVCTLVIAANASGVFAAV